MAQHSEDARRMALEVHQVTSRASALAIMVCRERVDCHNASRLAGSIVYGARSLVHARPARSCPAASTRRALRTPSTSRVSRIRSGRSSASAKMQRRSRRCTAWWWCSPRRERAPLPACSPGGSLERCDTTVLHPRR